MPSSGLACLMWLVDQLRWLRNHDTNITKCSGFYFMGSSGRGHVIHVELVWTDTLLKFVMKRRRLYTHGQCSHQGQRGHGWSSTVTGINRTSAHGLFCISNSVDFIHVQFGARAIQMLGSQLSSPIRIPSVVIANQNALAMTIPWSFAK